AALSSSSTGPGIVAMTWLLARHVSPLRGRAARYKSVAGSRRARSCLHKTAVPPTPAGAGVPCPPMPDAPATPLIHARGLTKRFGAITAVHAIDFDVDQGESFGFLGPNGAGKTSTMRMIGCVSPVSAGTLSI